MNQWGQFSICESQDHRGRSNKKGDIEGMIREEKNTIRTKQK